MTAFRLAVLLVAGLCLCGQQVRSACVTLSWTATGDDGAAGTASLYDIRYSRSVITDDNWEQATPARVVPTPQPAGSREEWLVSELDPGTRYYFAIKAADENDNWSPLSNVVSKVAPMQVCTGVVGNVNCDADHDVDLVDVIHLANYLFLNGQICCPEEANVTADPQGDIDLTDVLALVEHLFYPSDPLPTCP